MTRRIGFLSLPLIILFLGCFASDDPVEDLKLTWPIEIESEKGIITTLYQPQLESYHNNDLEDRMAVTGDDNSKI